MTAHSETRTQAPDVDPPEALAAIVEAGFDVTEFPLAAGVESGVLIYDGRECLGHEGERREASA